MAVRQTDEEDAGLSNLFMAPPVEGGTGYVESLGSWIDNLMGDRRIRKDASARVAAHVDEINRQHGRGDSGKPLSSSSPPTQPPPPVPGGTGTETKGGKPGETRPKP